MLNLVDQINSVTLLDIVIYFGSILGSIKTSRIIHNDINTHKCIDISIGIFCGVMAGYYYSNELNMYISGLIAMLGGISGALVTTVIVELLPNTLKKLIDNYIQSKLK